MFNIIKSGVTRQQAEELYPNDYIVLLIIKKSSNETKGDIIFIGSSSERWIFTEKHDPPEGYTFYMLRGNNLKEYTPIEEGVPCYSN